MTDTQLQNLIAALSTNTKALEAVMARDPAKEYAYGEGNVGQPKQFGPCNVIETHELLYQGYNSAISGWDLVSQIGIQFWKFNHAVSVNSLTSPAVCLTIGAKISFSNTPNFNESESIIVNYTPVQITSSFTLNGGGVAFYLNEIVPVKKRYVRFQNVNVGNGGGAYALVNMGSAYNNYTSLRVTAFGD